MKLHTRPPWLKSLLTVLLVVCFTGFALGLHALGVTDASIVLTLLMSVVLSSWAFGLPYSLLSSVLAILAHSFFFSVPLYSFEVYDPQNITAFGFLVAMGLVVGTLSGKLREQVADLAVRESRLETLHRLGQALSGKIDRREVVSAAESLLSEILGGKVRITDSDFVPPAGTRAFSLAGAGETAGWLTLDPAAGPDPLVPERQLWIETLLAPVALALERADLIREQRLKARDLEATLTTNTILQGISHDLRTPLTVISATAGTILERTPVSDPRYSDLMSLAQEAQALARQVENLLELTALNAGSVVPRKEWVPWEDLVSSCFETFSVRFPEVRPLFHPPDALGLCWVDETLVTKALTNLLENAAVYAPGTIEISVRSEASEIRFEVSDRGPGVDDTEKMKVFQQFTRGRASQKAVGHRGTGLGLALVLAVAELHGGTAGVDDQPGGGSVFWFTLDQSESPPLLWSAAG